MSWFGRIGGRSGRPEGSDTGAAQPRTAKSHDGDSPAIFISYRRSNVFETDQLYHHLLTRFDSSSIFIDRSDIAPGEAFPDRIQTAASQASVMLLIIGPQWISEQDPVTLRRRLELKDDWVRREIETAIEHRVAIIPVLVSGTAMPTAAQWPAGLEGIGHLQAASLSNDAFYRDAVDLVSLVGARLGAERMARLAKGTGNPYPPEGPYKPLALSAEALEQMVKSLPQWRLVTSPVGDDPRFDAGYVRVELVRDFQFESFLDAIDFMRQAADWIDKFGHHPRWSNVFCTVTVGYCTFEAGHRPTDRDHKSAEALDRLYKDFHKK